MFPELELMNDTETLEITRSGVEPSNEVCDSRTSEIVDEMVDEVVLE